MEGRWELKQCSGVLLRFSGNVQWIHSPKLGEGGDRVGQESRLIGHISTADGGLIRGVSLHKNAIHGQNSRCRTALLVVSLGQAAGKGEVESEFQVALSHLNGPREAVHHAASLGHPHVAENVEASAVGAYAVNHHGFVQQVGHCELGHKALFLCGMGLGGKASMMVQAHLAKRYMGVFAQPVSKSAQGFGAFRIREEGRSPGVNAVGDMEIGVGLLEL